MGKTQLSKVILMTLMGLTLSIPASAEWKKENDKWIWTENNQKITGWQNINSKWYHFDENGYMNTGWLEDNNQWYRFNDEGVMSISWQNIDNNWYYFNESGVMQSGWFKDNEKWYHTSLSGIMDKGWNEIDGEWYMFNEDGSMCTGWINDNGTWYYADMGGRLQRGDISIEGKTYSFAQNGAMLGGESSSQLEQESNESSEKIGYVNTNSGLLNVRTDSDINSSILHKLPKGAEVTITGDIKNGFYPINFNNNTAWVSSDWISFEKPAGIQQNTVIDDSLNDNEDGNSKEGKLENETVDLNGIRTTEPSLNDIHYYSDSNIFYKVRLSPPFFNSAGQKIRGNCTWYAWGRAWELTGKQPIQANFIGNAYEWWNANIKSGKYEYGSEPRVGSIAVWNSSLPDSGGCGHVAVVEKIDNGKIYISESMWHGDCFKYQEIYSTEYLYGYIYLDKENY
ncbi:CHAP domain-containing protein [uncultured Clostridium sp.]|uniref:CHAP domain-containing protein n=1 Tax=uncultured Clostridium sp. TaxID=59620 RepID=UPI0025EDB8BA|nr:CHAP domain-containing protein [uncultured Clostridium sp.]